MDATNMFLQRHKSTHARVDRLTNGLTEEQVRGRAHPAANPLAWLLWHMARIEDASINLLIGGGPQVLNEDWLSRLGVARRDVGAGMTMADVAALCAAIDLTALRAYWEAVGQRTTEIVTPLTPVDLDEVVSPDRIHWAINAECMVDGPTGPRLQELWKGMTKGYFLVYLPLTHIYEHIGQADLLRGLLGKPGPF